MIHTFDASEVAQSRYAPFPRTSSCIQSYVLLVTEYLKPFKMHIVSAEV